MEVTDSEHPQSGIRNCFQICAYPLEEDYVKSTTAVQTRVSPRPMEEGEKKLVCCRDHKDVGDVIWVVIRERQESL